MSDTSTGDRRQTDPQAPDREWESVVRRISDRIRTGAGPASPAAAQAADLTQELARLERRALDAEATLTRERDVYASRVAEMEGKLRKLEPWLRRLRSEFQEASTERDRLRDRLTQVEKESASAGARPSEGESVLRAELEAAAREAEAAKAARDAALADAASLRQRLDNDLRNLQDSWRQRIEQAEAARDKALDDAKALRQQLGGQRRLDEELKRLTKECEQLETTTAAHKAVARAAQEEADGLRQRISEAEKAAAKSAEEARGWVARVEDATKKLEAAEADLRRLRDENSEYALRVASAESAAKDLRAESERARAEATEKDRALGGAKGEIEILKRTIEKLRSEVSDSRQAAERNHGETQAARREAEQNARSAEKLSSELAAEKQRAAAEAEMLRKESAEHRELADEAMRSEEQLRRNHLELQQRFTSEEQNHGEAKRRIHDLETRVDGIQLEFADVRHALEQARANAAALEGEKANLLRTLDEERAGAAKRFETTEASWRSQMRAVEGRFEADIQKERQRVAAIEETMAEAERRHEADLAARDVASQQFRLSAAEYVRQRAQELLDCAARIGSGEVPETAIPVVPAEDVPEPTVAVGPVVPVAEPVPQEISPAQPEHEEPSDWDRLLNDVQALRSEVEGLRAPDEKDDTASVSIDPDVGTEDPARTSTVEASGTEEVAVATSDDRGQDADLRGGRSRKRRK